MRYLSISLFAFIVACTTSTSTETPVVELSDQSQINLCENFLDDVCAVDPTICDDVCVDTGCSGAVADGDVDFNCDIATDGGDITAEIVEDCGLGDNAACNLGGDCILDALDDFCGN